MSVIRRSKDTFLIRVYMGHDPLTKKRVDVNETVHGTISYAKKREAQLKAQKYSGQLVKSSRMTVAALFDLYLDSVRHTVSVVTHYKYSYIYRSYIRPHIGHILIDKIKHGDIQHLFNLLLDPKKEGNGDEKNERVSVGIGLSVRTVDYVRGVLNCAFRFALNNHLIADNPVSRTKLPFLGRPRSDSLTIEEAKAFVSVRSRYWYGDALVFQLQTGLRSQELMALIWDDVDFDAGTLRIERACKMVDGLCIGIGAPKTERGNRVIAISPDLLTLLRCHYEVQREIIEKHVGPQPYGTSMVKDWIRRERPRHSHLYTRIDLIFPKRNGGIPTRTTVEDGFNSMLRRAGISGERKLRQYDLRHTHASFLYAEGVPSIDIAARLGNSIAVCDRTYGHPLKERRGIPSQVFADLVPLW
jgi:integrase